MSDLITTELDLIPYPKNLSYTKDTKVTVYPYINKNGITQELDNIISVFSSFTFKLFAKEFYACEDENAIDINIDTSLKIGEYIILSDKKITITFNDKSGFSHALSTLLQLIRYEDDRMYIPKIEIHDYPDSEYRGLMIDVARRSHPFETLKSFVDLCFLFKLNYLHFHFTDDQSYTLPSSKIEPIKNNKGFHYSFKEIEELNKIAYKAGVTIIPEIEIPGHASYLVKNGDGLFASKDHKYTMCLANDSTLSTLKTLISEVCEMFPNSPYIHVGADEVDTSEWEACECCKKYLKENSLSSMKELYSIFVGKATDMVLENGRTPIVWEGFPREGEKYISKKTIVEVFVCAYNMPHHLIEDGYTIINTSFKPLYITPKLSWPNVDVYDWNITEFDHWHSHSKAYKKAIKLDNTNNLMGAMYCSWENTYEGEFDIVKNSLSGFSESVWTHNKTLSSLDFFKRYYYIYSMINKCFTSNTQNNKIGFLF